MTRNTRADRYRADFEKVNSTSSVEHYLGHLWIEQYQLIMKLKLQQPLNRFGKQTVTFMSLHQRVHILYTSII